MGLVLIKKGAEGHMAGLMDEGIVYMRRLGGFTDMESKVVGDKNEGLLSRYPAENKTMKVTATLPNGVVIPLEGVSLNVHSSARTHGVYCMYAVEVPNGDTSFNFYGTFKHLMEDPLMAEFGECFVFFRDTREFLKRLINAARSAGYELDHGPVEYVPIEYTGAMDPFKKLSPYSYQKEWRALTDKPLPGPDLVLKLGSLKDICFMMRP